MQGPLLYLSVNDHKLGVFCGPWRRASVYRPGCSLARGPAFGLTFEKKNYRACAENCICHYQLVFEIVRRAIELSRFRYGYDFLTHFSQWWPILNDCSFSHFSLKYCSQLVACPSLQEFESGSGKGWRAPWHSARRLGHWSQHFTRWYDGLCKDYKQSPFACFIHKNLGTFPRGPLVQLST